MQNNDIIVIIDTVEDDEWEGKAFKKIITKAGETYKLGKHLLQKYNLLAPGVALRLIMDNYQGREYVKDYDACINLATERIKELSQPAPKNPKDLSIEKQTAVKCVSRMMAGGVELPEDIKTMTLEWIRSALK
jgi:hypothetical protein